MPSTWSTKTPYAVGCRPPNTPLELPGGELTCFTQGPVAAGRSAPGR